MHPNLPIGNPVKTGQRPILGPNPKFGKRCFGMLTEFWKYEDESLLRVLSDADIVGGKWEFWTETDRRAEGLLESVSEDWLR